MSTLPLVAPRNSSRLSNSDAAARPQYPGPSSEAPSSGYTLMKLSRLRMILYTEAARRPGSASSKRAAASQLESIHGVQLLRFLRSPKPIHQKSSRARAGVSTRRSTSARIRFRTSGDTRSEEHTSELQSQSNLVCRLLLEKKKHN